MCPTELTEVSHSYIQLNWISNLSAVANGAERTLTRWVRPCRRVRRRQRYVVVRCCGVKVLEREISNRF
jgi:hypothetical protein